MFAPPHGLSQRTTSFIASQRQGIHRIPLRHLIALIIDAHPFAHKQIRKIRFFGPMRSAEGSRRLANLRKLKPLEARSIERPFASNTSESVAVKPRPHWLPAGIGRLGPNGDRICFLFTMTDSARSADAAKREFDFIQDDGASLPATRRLVEPDGIEPTTSCLQSTRSPN